jgi:AraC-like DNA-binding protein
MVSYWKITSGVQLVLLNVAPASIVTQDIDRMRRNTLVFVLLALLASFGFIFYLSNVLYKPISTVLTRAREMENRENRNLYGFKNTFFQNVAWGRSEYTAPVLLEYGKDIGLAIEAFAEIEAIVFKVDGYAGFCIEHDVSDRNLYKQRFINIARELMRTIGPCEVVDMGDDVFMQVHNRSPQAMDRQEICDYVRKVQLAVKEAYSVSLTVAVSDPGMGLGSLKTLFHSAVDMTKQKLWVGNGCIFFSDSRARKDDAAYRYPLAKERILEEGLRLGRTSDAIKSFNALLWSAEDYSFSVYQSVITAAAVIVSRTVAQMPEGSIPTRAKDSFHIIREAEACETADEVGEYFLQLFQSIREYANDTKQNKHQMVVEQAMKIIQEDYRDCNLCLNSIAERISLSPAYLGKIFKTATAMAIADYINYVRLEKAKILLKETQDTIQDIMQATGFLSSGYFYTQFKKVNAMTPREYRQELGKQNHQKM